MQICDVLRGVIRTNKNSDNCAVSLLKKKIYQLCKLATSLKMSLFFTGHKTGQIALFAHTL